MTTRLPFFSRLINGLPRPVRRIGAHLLSALVGVFAAVALHYVLYRIGLPLEPFIYVSF